MQKTFIRLIDSLSFTLIICLLIRIPFLPSGSIWTFITDTRGFTAVIAYAIGLAVTPALITIFLYPSSLRRLGMIHRLYRIEIFSAWVIFCAIGNLIYGNNCGAIMAPIIIFISILGIILCIYSHSKWNKHNK